MCINSQFSFFSLFNNTFYYEIIHNYILSTWKKIIIYILEASFIYLLFQGKEITKRSVKIVATLLIVLNVLLLVSLLGLVIGWRELRKRSMQPHEQTLCINCTEIGLGDKELPEDVKGKIYRDKSNDGKDLVCCGHTSDLLNWMVDKVSTTLWYCTFLYFSRQYVFTADLWQNICSN